MALPFCDSRVGLGVVNVRLRRGRRSIARSVPVVFAALKPLATVWDPLRDPLTHRFRLKPRLQLFAALKPLAAFFESLRDFRFG